MDATLLVELLTEVPKSLFSLDFFSSQFVVLRSDGFHGTT
jgi:hypothetical protein